MMDKPNLLKYRGMCPIKFRAEMFGDAQFYPDINWQFTDIFGDNFDETKFAEIAAKNDKILKIFESVNKCLDLANN